MWPWIKRWRDWAMFDFWPVTRTGPQPQALHYSSELAGLTLHDQPIPWNAEAVSVEALLCLRTSPMRRKADFQLRLSRQEVLPPHSLRRVQGEDVYRLVFRFLPPGQSGTADLLWRGHVLGQLPLPVQGREEFLQNLRLQMPTLFVRLGDQSVACQTFVATQCRGLLASAVITSPTSLVPLLDLGVQVEFRSERGSTLQSVPACLCSSQLSGRQALISIVPRRFPRRIGNWTATWYVADRPLATQQVRAISQRVFQRSLRVTDTSFLIQTEKQGLTLAQHVPNLNGLARVGPYFLVSSCEPGMAGLCSLQVRAQVPGSVKSPVLLEEEILITDGPTRFAPGTLDAGDLGQVSAFELRLKGTTLSVLSLCPAPTANFTNEGGFKGPPEFSWSEAAEEELDERLTRLLEGRGNTE
jgi:hypothetical protein